MTQYVIDIGAVPDDGQGDPLRTAFAFTNDNFSQIFESGPVGSNVKIANNTITTTVINSNLILSPSGIGKIQVNNTLLPRIDNVYDLGSLSQRFNTIYVGSGGLDITGGIVVSGNITADYFIGNGSALTGIVATTGSRVVNGNSNINIPAAGSNIFVTVNGTGNIVVFSNTGAYVAGEVSATGNITGNYILGNGALLTGINANYSNANVAAYLPTYTGNLVSLTGPVTTTANVTGANLRTSGQITATGNITGGNVDTGRVNAANITVGGPVSASGNITGNYILGNGALLTGINANYSNANVTAYLPTYTGNLVSLTGPVTTTANVTGANIRTTGQITATGNITGGNVDTGRVNAATITASGNVSGAYFLGDGSQLTNLPAGNYSNANVTAYLPTYTGNLVSLAGPVTTTANITGANIRATGQITATGNVTAGNVDTGRVNAATVTVAGPVSASGNVTGAYFLGDGSQLTNLPAGNYSNANVAAYLPTYTGNLVSLTGPVTTTANITGGNLVTSGQATVTGNITAGNVDATKVNAVTVAASGSISAVGNITGNNLIGVTVTGTTVTATANVVGGNITTAGQISSTGNITGGNLSVPGGTVSSLTVSAAGNIRGGNLVTPGFITATGNITGGNVDTGNIHAGNVNVDSVVSAQGNVYGDTFVGNGLVIFGNASLGNTSVSGTIGATVVSASGNVIGGNLLTTGKVSASGNVSGNYFVGNGALLTGITVSAGSSLLNGNSNVVVATNGNVTVGVSGISNIAQFANTGAYVTGVISATGNIAGSYLLGNGAFITGLPAGYSNADVAAFLPTYSGNLPNLTGLVSTTGNVAGNYFIGNGSLLTGVTASGVNANALTGNTLSSNVLNSSLTSVGTLSNLSVTGNTNSGNLSTGGAISATGNITGSNLLTAGLISATANVIGGNVITSGIISATGNATVDNLSTAGLITATGNISGNNIFATGLASVTGNVIAGNVNTSAIRPTSGELTITTASGNLNLQPTGNIVLANTYINSVAYPAQDTDAATKLYVDNMVSTAIAYHTPVYAATTTTLASSTGGTITYAQPNGVANGVGATLTTTGSFNLVDTSNVQTLGTRILVKDQADAVQNGIYTWANATAIVRATDADEYGPDSSQQISVNDYFFTSTGNVNVGSAFIVNSPIGTITFGTSNITFALFSQTTAYTANLDAGLSLTGTVFSAKVDLNTTAFDAGGNIIVKAGANLTTPNIGAATGASLNLVGNVNSGNVNTGGLVSATGNITGGNVLTAGLISATGNATLGNVLTGGLVSATANVTAGNLVTGGLITATGNIIVGNVGTAGLISAAGNIQGGNFLTGGLVSATGNATLGNILTSGLISSTGNITSTANISGGNVLTGGLVSVAGNITGGNILSNNYYYANGTPVPPGIVYTANTAPPVSPAPKVTDQWYDTANDVLYQYLDDGTSDYWVDTTSPAFAGGVVANVAISGTLVPVANVTYDIGTSTVYFHNTYTQNLYTNNRLPAYNMPVGAVVQTVMSSSLGGSITNSTSYADISYANVTITPSSATSKVFVMATGTTSFTSLAGQDVTADAQLVRSPSTSLQIQTCGTTVSGGGIGVTGSVSYSYVDNPGTTSPVTYKLQQKVSNASSTLTSTNIWLIAMEITAS